MTFLSLEFITFLLIFLPIYWYFGEKPQKQNIILLLGGMLLITMVHWVFAISVACFSMFIYFIAHKINYSYQYTRKIWFFCGLTVIFLHLGFFKYFDFFRPTLQSVFQQEIIDILMPLGISYYTFQGLAYLVSVYQRSQIYLTAPQLLLHFSFFPTVTSGPIIRTDYQKTIDGIQMGMAPQIQTYEPRYLVKPALAISLMLLGVTKKWWLGGTLEENWVTPVFENPLQYDVFSVLIAIYGYTFQLFLDFSGYTDFVIGMAMLLGFQLPNNFHMPLIAHNLRDFWNRWHITLSSWIRDYIYVPLGGSQKGFIRTQINVIVAMLVSGIWHGSGWNFLLWGLSHGLALAALNIADKKYGRNALSKTKKWGKVVAIFATLTFVSMTFVIFKTETLADANLMFQALLGSGRGWVMPSLDAILVGSIFIGVIIFYQKLVAGFNYFVSMLEYLPIWAWILPIAIVLLFLLIVAPSGVPGFIYANF